MTTLLWDPRWSLRSITIKWRSTFSDPAKHLGSAKLRKLSHALFAVMGLFALFVRLGKPIWGVPVLFVSALFAAGLLGWIIAVLFAEPMNLWLRRRTGAEESFPGSAQPQVD